ncbi:hypothetical protein [Roseibium sp.]|uniref:hypothetical protein n=1 Tax=Roseibium sp. TaxID=1936156 RepID=UPI003A975EFE
MFAINKVLGAPIAAILVASTLAGGVEAAPRSASPLDLGAGGLVMDVDARQGPRSHQRDLREGRHGGGRDRDWRGGHGRGWDSHGPGHHRWHRMGPREVRRSLRHRGFHKIRIVDSRPFVFKVRATGHDGMRFRLVVDRTTGQILRMRPAGHRFHWSYRW